MLPFHDAWNDSRETIKQINIKWTRYGSSDERYHEFVKLAPMLSWCLAKQHIVQKCCTDWRRVEAVALVVLLQQDCPCI